VASSLLSRLAKLKAACGAEFYARRLLHRSRLARRLRLAMSPRTAKLLCDGRIDEHLRVAVDEGVELDVWLIRGRGERAGRRGSVLVLHGLWDSKARLLAVGEQLAGRGYDVVLPDLRGHGRSSGEHTTFGALEKRDACRLMDALAARGRIREPRYAFGYSMGAAVAVQYAAIEPRCRGVIAVAPFADGPSIVRRACPLMARRKYDALWARAAEIARFDPDETSTVAAAAARACPLTVIHGRLDWLVPHSHGKAVFDAARPPKRLITIGWADHFTILLGRAKWFADRLDRIATDEQPQLPPAPLRKAR
jgi:pimeloyl-ACP methyl ester carboxylesterase